MISRRPVQYLALASLFAAAFRAGATPTKPEKPAEPVDIGFEEKVQVRLVTMDVTVLDKDDRTVTGLKPEDFELRVDGKVVPVETLDEACAEGPVEEPKAVRSASERPAAPSSEAPTRIALVVDYLHLGILDRARTLDRLKEIVRSGKYPRAEFLVAALTGGLRVEQPFTGDAKEVLRTLERMERDITLWNGHFQHMTEKGLFLGLEALCDVLAVAPGPKAVVLFSQWLYPPDGDLNFYESSFRRLGVLAAAARVNIYPVDTAGLVPPGERSCYG